MKTMIDAVAHDVTEGKVLVNGVAYSIKQGKTLVNGVAYDIGGNAAPGMKELWADAQPLGIGGGNSSKYTTAIIRTITASDSQVYILFFTGTGMAVYTVSGTNSGDKFTPTGGITLIYSQNLSTATGDLITINDKKIQSTQKYYGVTMAAISFPSYAVDQVTSAFNNLTYVNGTGVNSSTKLNLSIPVADEQASDVMFLATSSTLKVYTPPLDSTNPTSAWSANYSAWELGHPTGFGANNWYVVMSSGDAGSFYGGTLIAFKEG